MNNQSLEKEISLLDVLAYIYLFFTRRWKLILIITILGISLGVFKNLGKLKQKKYYEVKIKISSPFLRAELLNNAVLPLTNGKKSFAELSFSNDLLSIHKLENSDAKDTTLFINATISNQANIDNIVLKIFELISSDMEIKAKIKQIDEFRTNYIIKINEKISETENYNKQLLVNVVNSKQTPIFNSIYSNKEYFQLIEKRFYLELNKDVRPLNCNIISTSEIQSSSAFIKSIVFAFFISLFLACGLGFCIELFIKIRNHAKKLV